MKDDSLDQSNPRRRRSSHTKDNLCSVTVRKDDPKEKAGIRLEQEANGRVRVSNIASNGLFANSEVEIGDIILSVNGKRLSSGEGPESLVEVIKKAKSTVTVVVKKGGLSSLSEVSKEIQKVQDNDRSGKDGYYGGQSKHKTDGSIDYDYKPGASVPTANQAIHGNSDATTISATKEDPLDVNAGLAFVVQKKMLFVSEMSNASIFASTSLKVGDRVLSINDMSFRDYADAKYAQTIIKRAKEAVTLVVEKGVDGFKKPSKSTLKPAKPIEKKEKSDSDLSSTESSSCPDGDQIFPLRDTKFKEILVAAPKAFSKQDTGLEFYIKDKKLFVYKLKPSSLFLNTSLAEGDRVLAINDTNFEEATDVDVALGVCVRATESVALRVLKEEAQYTQAEFNLDASVGNLNWQ